MRGLPNLAVNGAVQTSKPSAPPPAPVDNRAVPAHELQTGLMGMVPTMGNTKVTVGFHGDQAFCIKKYAYVNLPMLPPGAMIPISIAMEMRGFAAHETAHLLWTDEHALETMRTEEEKKNKLFHETWNSIEDYMIERNWLLLFEGAHKNFTATEERCCRGYMELWNRNPEVAKDLRIVGPVAMTWMRSIYFGLTTPASAQCLATLPAGLQKRVQDWFDSIIDVATTADCIDAARRVYADIVANPFDPLDPPQNTQLPQGAQGQGQGQGGSQGQGGGTPGGGANGLGSATGAPQAGQNQAMPQPITTSASLDAAIAELKKSGIVPQKWTSFAINTSADAGPYQAALVAPEGRQEYAKAEASVAATANTAASALRRILVTQTRSRWKGGRADGILDDRRVADVITGVSEIYRKKTKAEDIDTAVSILVDCSGSMGGVIGLCQQLSVVLHKALYGTPVKYEILGFTTGDDSHLPDHAKTMKKAVKAWNTQNAGTGKEINADFRSVSIYEFKPFDGALHEVNVTIGNMPSMPMGGTPTADAIVEAHKRLSRRREKRHVMFVLTDGAPDDVTECKRAVKAVEAAGVTVIGVGINSSAVKNCFRDWVQITDPRDLTAVIINSIAGSLARDKRLVGRNKAVDLSAVVAA